MITARTAGLRAKATEEIQGTHLVIYNSAGQPMAIFAEVSPTLAQMYSPFIDREEFTKAARLLSIPIEYEATVKKVGD